MKTEAKLSRPWTRAIFQYPQKPSSAQGWRVQGECHSAGWQPVWGKDINMKVTGGPALASLASYLLGKDQQNLLPSMLYPRNFLSTEIEE